MPLTVDGHRETGLLYGYDIPETPTSNGPYVLDVRINAAHLPGGKLADFRRYWDGGMTGGPLFFVEPYSKVYKPTKCCPYDNEFQANDWFSNWYWKMKSVSFKFSGTDIVDWRLAVDGDYIDTQGALLDKTGDRFTTFGLDLTTWENNNPGSWQLIGVSEVPVPATGWLILTGLAGIGMLRRRGLHNKC